MVISVKRLTLLTLVLSVGVLVHSTPLFSETDDTAKQKNECLLIARDCGSAAQWIQDKIEKLQEEIEKGTRVYRPEELEALKQKLDETDKILDFLGDQPPYIDERQR